MSTDAKDWIRNKSDEVAYDKGCRFDISKPLRFQSFCSKFIRHTEAPWAPQVFELQQWQWERVIAPAFGWVMPDGTRRFKEVETWIPKKNGKSTMAAAIALYLIIADGEYGAKVYSAASDRNQASLIFNVASEMVKINDDLDSTLRVRKTIKKIYFDEMSSVYEVISSEGRRNEGFNIHGLLFDELHTQPNRKLWAALRYGSAARRQGIRFILSTAGELDEELLWWERFNFAKQIQNSEAVDIHILPCVYASEEGDDPYSEDTWRKCNPSYDHSINKVEFARDADNAKKNGQNESEFLRYRLNRPTKFESAWIRYQYWHACVSPQPPTPVAGMSEEYLGIDLADTTDMNAATFVKEVLHPTKLILDEFGDPTPMPCLHVKPHFWLPGEAGLAQNKGNRERYERWIERGLINVIPGPIAHQQVLEDDVVTLCNDRIIGEIGVDRFLAKRFCYGIQVKMRAEKMWKKDLIRLVPYTAPQMTESVKWLEELIYLGAILHDNNPILNWMFGNIRCSSDSSGNRKLDKGENSKGKIDGFAALCMALYCMINKEPKFISKYSTEKLRTVEM